MKYTKTENVLDEIDWGNGRKFFKAKFLNKMEGKNGKI